MPETLGNAALRYAIGADVRDVRAAYGVRIAAQNIARFYADVAALGSLSLQAQQHRQQHRDGSALPARWRALDHLPAYELALRLGWRQAPELVGS